MGKGQLLSGRNKYLVLALGLFHSLMGDTIYMYCSVNGCSKHAKQINLVARDQSSTDTYACDAYARTRLTRSCGCICPRTCIYFQFTREPAETYAGCFVGVVTDFIQMGMLQRFGGSVFLLFCLGCFCFTYVCSLAPPLAAVCIRWFTSSSTMVTPPWRLYAIFDSHKQTCCIPNIRPLQHSIVICIKQAFTQQMIYTY